MKRLFKCFLHFWRYCKFWPRTLLQDYFGFRRQRLWTIMAMNLFATSARSLCGKLTFSCRKESWKLIVNKLRQQKTVSQKICSMGVVFLKCTPLKCNGASNYPVTNFMKSIIFINKTTYRFIDSILCDIHLRKCSQTDEIVSNVNVNSDEFPLNYCFILSICNLNMWLTFTLYRTKLITSILKI